MRLGLRPSEIVFEICLASVARLVVGKGELLGAQQIADLSLKFFTFISDDPPSINATERGPLNPTELVHFGNWKLLACSDSGSSVVVSLCSPVASLSMRSSFDGGS